MMLAVDWVAVSSITTAGATLVLALATFASVRSANRAARAAERSLLANLRPLLVQSRLADDPQKVGFADDKWFLIPGSGGVAEVTDAAVYFAIAVRNVGSGIAVLHGWHLHARVEQGAMPEHPPVEQFRRLTRDLYIAPARSASGRARSATPPSRSSPPRARRSRSRAASRSTCSTATMSWASARSRASR